MSELPKGWVEENFSNLIEIIRGVTFSKDDRADWEAPDYVGCLRTSNVQKSLNIDDLAFIPRSKVKRTVIPVSSAGIRRNAFGFYPMGASGSGSFHKRKILAC